MSEIREPSIAAADIPPAPGLLRAAFPPGLMPMGGSADAPDVAAPPKKPDLNAAAPPAAPANAAPPAAPANAAPAGGADVYRSQRPPLSTASGPSDLGNAIIHSQGPLTPELGRRSGVRPEFVPIINWIASGESHGYNELYDGSHFSDMSDHPANLGWKGMKGPDGRPTHAAGLLQWEPATWNEAKCGYNGGRWSQGRCEYHGPPSGDQVHDFSDVSQNKVGQYWIEKTYREKTGRDIVADLWAGKTDQLIPALKGQWPSLGKGDTHDQARYAGLNAMAPLNEERRRTTEASIAQYERDRSAILAEALKAPVGSEERRQMLHEAHEHARELTKLYEDKIKSPPEKKPADVFAGWGGIAIALAALAGSRSAQPLTASLNAMSGAMDAMNQGNYRDYEDRMKIWDKQSSFALKAIDIQNQEIREILEDQHSAEAEKQARLNTFYHVAGMDQQIALQQRGEITAEIGNLWKMIEFGEKLQNETEKTDQWRQNFDQRERLHAGAGGGTPYQPVDAENKPVGPPVQIKGGVATPIQGLPEGAGGLTRVGAKSASGSVTDTQAEWVATYIQKIGQWPAAAGRNIALQNKVEQVLAKRGVDPTQIAVALGAFRADQTALSATTKLRDLAHSYEETALRNLDQATKEMAKTAPTGFGPWLNHWVVSGEMQMGDTRPPAAIAAVLTFANEYAKVMSGATGAQAATDSSRREAAEIFSPYFSKGQWDEAARIAKTDMGNRMTSLDDEVELIKSRMGRGGEPARSGPAAPAPVGNLDATPEQYEKLPRGGAYTVPGDPIVRYKQ